MAVDHHAFAGIEQKRGSDVLAGQRVQGDGIGMQGFEQIGSDGAGAVEVAMLDVDDQWQIRW